MAFSPIVFQALEYNYVISEVCLDDNPDLSTVNQPLSLYVFFQTVGAKQL